MISDICFEFSESLKEYLKSKTFYGKPGTPERDRFVKLLELVKAFQNELDQVPLDEKDDIPKNMESVNITFRITRWDNEKGYKKRAKVDVV